MTIASANKIVVQFSDEGDGTGELFVSGSANGFAGTASTWIGKEELKKFAQALTRYPLSESSLPTLSGGFGFSGRDDLSQEHVFIQVYPVDSLGHLGVQVRLATEVWPHDRIEAQHRVQFEIRTGYQALLEFSRTLNDVLEGKTEEAVLISDQ